MAIVKQGGNTIKVDYITDLTGLDNKVIKKNVRGAMIINLTDITAVDVYYDAKAQLNPAKCRIFHEQLGWMTLNEPFEEIAHLKMDGTIQVKGFVQKKKKLNNNNTKTKKTNGKSRQRNS